MDFLFVNKRMLAFFSVNDASIFSYKSAFKLVLNYYILTFVIKRLNKLLVLHAAYIHVNLGDLASLKDLIRFWEYYFVSKFIALWIK